MLLRCSIYDDHSPRENGWDRHTARAKLEPPLTCQPLVTTKALRTRTSHGDPARGPLPPSDVTNKERADCLPPYLQSGQKLLVPRTNQLVSCTGTALLERRDPTAEGASQTYKRAPPSPPQQRASRRFTSLPPGEALLVCRPEALTQAVQDWLFCAELSTGLAAGRVVSASLAPPRCSRATKVLGGPATDACYEATGSAGRVCRRGSLSRPTYCGNAFTGRRF
ncbi:hypothetical protein NDU88_004900 [Pleurodeles waltl]|uniref:Uncharacterized protein n=1 Tax=Pleurodeles waltl TaxID=8319 RepID=A0AAV7N4C4_PLEWA|nr:hypothetical protein NDU88_004900 [Pleurodeles waltl]